MICTWLRLRARSSDGRARCGYKAQLSGCFIRLYPSNDVIGSSPIGCTMKLYLAKDMMIWATVGDRTISGVIRHIKGNHPDPNRATVVDVYLAHVDGVWCERCNTYEIKVSCEDIVSVSALTFDQAVDVLGQIDWDDESDYTDQEREAIIMILAQYMMGKFDRELTAELLHSRPEDLPTPWRGNA